LQHLYNVQVLHKLSLAAPPKILVENYMIEIARTYQVPFEPDPLVMMVSGVIFLIFCFSYFHTAASISASAHLELVVSVTEW